MRIDEEGWYPFNRFDLKPGVDHEIVARIRRVINPIPLVAREVRLIVPSFDTDIGFDFEVGDWVKPHGEGEEQDLSINFSREFLGRSTSDFRWDRIKRQYQEKSVKELNEIFGKWRTLVRLSAGDGGFVSIDDDFFEYCKMKMPHRAPASGYQDTIEVKFESGRTEEYPKGYFVRSRVVSDKNKIVSAHYAKVMGRIATGTTGLLIFTYYFNPRENDRNLEFDSRVNLADQRRNFSP